MDSVLVASKFQAGVNANKTGGMFGFLNITQNHRVAPLPKRFFIGTDRVHSGCVGCQVLMRYDLWPRRKLPHARCC